jgi:hypothetical protein
MLLAEDPARSCTASGGSIADLGKGRRPQHGVPGVGEVMTEVIMDESLRPGTERKLGVLTQTSDLDLHMRVEERRLEGYVWWNGRRCRLMALRDEEEAAAPTDRDDGPVPA